MRVVLMQMDLDDASLEFEKMLLTWTREKK